MRKRTGGGSKKIRELWIGRRRIRVRLFYGREQTAAPKHPRGWYMVARSVGTAAYALVGQHERIIAQASGVPLRSFASGEPTANAIESMSTFAQPIVFGDLETQRRPLVGYVGWLGTEGRGPTHVEYPVHDVTTHVTVFANVRYGSPGDTKGLRGELVACTTIDGKPVKDDHLTLTVRQMPQGGEPGGEVLQVNIPVEFADGVIALASTLLAQARRDGLLPTED